MSSPLRPAESPGSLRLPIIAVGLLSAAMLALQLTLTRLFAVAQFYHFAFMVISLALLGLGAAGSILTVWPRAAQSPGRWSAGFALAALAEYAILNLIPFDSYAIAWDRRQVLYLMLTLIGSAAPFLFSGLVISGLMTANPASLHRVYASNLAGSAVGGVITLPLLAWVGGEGALFASAALGMFAAALFWLAQRQRAGLAAASGLALLLVGTAVIRPQWAGIRLSPYKGLTQALLTPDAEHTISEWSATARVDVVESSSIHAMPGLSQNALIAAPPLQAGLTLDGDNLMPITSLAPEDDLARQLAASVPQAVIPALRPDAESYLVLEPGAGWDVLMALANGAPSVIVAERDPLVVEVLQGPYEDFSHGIYTDARVEVVTAQGRTFVRRTDRTYDVVIAALSDTYHPVTSGAYSLSEDYRYTVEAVGDYLDVLGEGGVLVMTRWLQTPPTESLRVVGTLDAALRTRGIEHPAEHIAAFREIRTITFLVSAEPLSEGDSSAVREFAAEQGYDIVWLPDVQPDEVNLRNVLPEPVYYQRFSELLANPDDFIRQYPFDIRPPRDNRPFFFHYFRWAQTPEILASLGQTWQPFGGSGYFVLVALLIIVSALAGLLIFGPLIVRGVKAHSPTPAPTAERERLLTGIRWRVLLYFFMLGLGFLFIEIPLAQQFILFLDRPVTALAVVIFALLIGSGVGSLTAPRWRLGAALPALVIAALLMPVLLRVVFDLAIGWSLGARIAVSVISMAPLGVLMGVPFSRGMRAVEAAAPGLTAWAWAINGSASVISGVLAVMAALSWGFLAVLWSGAAAYLIALLVIWPIAQTEAQHAAAR